MAMTHIQFDDRLQHGRLLRGALQKLEAGREELIKTKDVMITMIDGDGTLITHFDEVTLRFGFSNNTIAKSCWDEINSLLNKITTDASVTFVNTATLQLFNKLR